MAKSNFIVRGGGNFNPLYNEFNKAQKKMNGFRAGINKTMKGIGITLGSLAVGKLIKDSTKAAMSVESSIENISRNMTSSSQAFQHWVNTQSKGLGMAKDEAYQYGSTFSNLLGSFITDAKETSNQTQQLMKAAAIISSKTGRTYEDTANRIRSGMLGSTEAIEDLGIYTQVSMLESTEAFKKFAGNSSWAKLDFQTQQQIRLAAILEQSFKRYGDTLAGTTQTRQQIFLATLKNIRLNLGQAFLPIYNVVLPLLTSLANKLEYITGVFAAFTQALFGKAIMPKKQTESTQAQIGAVSDLGDAMASTGSATEKAGKQAKKALAGFDEINTLSKADVTGGSGGSTIGSGGSGGGGLVEETDDGTGGAMGNVATKASEMAVKVRTAFTDMKNAIVENKNIILPVLGAIAGALAGVAIHASIIAVIDFFKKFGVAVKLAWAILAAHPLVAIITAIGALIGALVTAYLTNDEFRAKVDKLWDTIKTRLTPIFEKLGEILKSIWTNVMVPMGNFMAGVFVAAFNGIGKVTLWLWKEVMEPLGKGLSWLWKEVIAPLSKIVGESLLISLKLMGDMAQSVWKNILVPLGSFLKTVLVDSMKAVIEIFKHWWDNVLKPLGSFISGTFKPIVEALIKVFEFLWNNVFKPLTQFMNSTFKTTFETVTKGIGTQIKSMETMFKGLMTFITGVFTGDWRKAWEGVKTIFKGVFDSLYGTVKTPLNLIIDAINTVIKGLNKIDIDVPNWVPGLGGKSYGINIKTIPKLATGGITNGPTLAMVGDNPGGKEVISPLDGLLDMIKVAVSDNGNNSNGDLTVVVKIGEDTITEKVVSNINRKSRISGKTIITV